MALRGSAGNGLSSWPGVPERATGLPENAKMSSPPPPLKTIVSLALPGLLTVMFTFANGSTETSRATQPTLLDVGAHA